jgi:hypothetical protein
VTVSDSQLTQQPARLDYQATDKLRLGKYSGQRRTGDGRYSGFHDVYHHPYITNYGTTVTYAISPTTFIEGPTEDQERTGGRQQGDSGTGANAWDLALPIGIRTRA